MTVSTDTARDQQLGDGVTTLFTVPFRVLDATHLQVLFTVAGVDTPQVLTTHYSVGAVGAAQATVAFVVAPPNATLVTFLRDVPITQETDYVPNDPFPAESHETALDKLTMIVQQLAEIIARAITLPPSSTQAQIQFPAAGAGKFIRWNLAGTALEAVSTVIDAGNYLASGIGAVVRSVMAKLGDTIAVEDYGAVGDGVSDDTVAINKAIDAAVALADGGVVNLGPKRYVVSALILKEGVTLRGAGMGATELVQTGAADYVVKAQGSLAASIALTANALAGATTLQLTSTATLAAGDRLVLSDALQYNPLDATYVSGEMVRVLTVDSGVQVTLYSPVKGSMASLGTYTTANTAIVRKLTQVAAPGIEELTITGDQATTTGLVALKYCHQPSVKNVALRRGGHYGLRVDTCSEAVVTGLVVSDLLDNIGTGHVGYGIVMAGANDGVVISDGHFSRCRHGVTTIGGPDGYTHRAVISGCLAHATTAAAFDTHAAGDGILFNSCEAHGSKQQGFSVRSINTEISSCLVSRCVNHGIAATETLVKNLAVRDCTVEYADQHGFSASSAVEGAILSGNTFRAPGNDGIQIASTSTFVQILDNYVIGPGRTGSNRSGIASIASGATAARWLVARNFIRADSGSVDNAITLPNVNTSYVVDNKAFGTFVSQAFILGDNLDLRNDVMDAMAVTPSQISADQNNYAPSGHAGTGNLRISSDAARAITGLQGGVDAREVTLTNVGAFTITLAHDSASSTAANRFLCPGSAGLALRTNGWVRLRYDGTSSRWRVMGA